MANVDMIVSAAIRGGILSFPSYDAPKDEADAAAINAQKVIVISEFYKDLAAALSE